LSPAEEIVWRIGDGIKSNARAIFSYRRVMAENEEYRKQIDQLKNDNLRLKEQVLAALRYNELSRLFNDPTLDKYNKIGASVINRNPSAWYHTIKVNKGSNDGVKMNYPVVANLGLVGKVVSVTPTTADILMITDGEGKVGAMVRDSQGKPIYGVLSGPLKEIHA
jgi:rod shape-determining protein MreC